MQQKCFMLDTIQPSAESSNQNEKKTEEKTKRKIISQSDTSVKCYSHIIFVKALCLPSTNVLGFSVPAASSSRQSTESLDEQVTQDEKRLNRPGCDGAERSSGTGQASGMGGGHGGRAERLGGGQGGKRSQGEQIFNIKGLVGEGGLWHFERLDHRIKSSVRRSVQVIITVATRQSSSIFHFQRQPPHFDFMNCQRAAKINAAMHKCNPQCPRAPAKRSAPL